MLIVIVVLQRIFGITTVNEKSVHFTWLTLVLVTTEGWEGLYSLTTLYMGADLDLSDIEGMPFFPVLCTQQ